MDHSVCVSVSVYVCLCVDTLEGKWFELSIWNLVHSCSACIDLEVKRSKVKITWFTITVTLAQLLWPLCYCCRHGTACHMTAQVS